MTATIQRGPDGVLLVDGKRVACAVMAPSPDDRICVRDLLHNGPHRHPGRGEWLNQRPDVVVCNDKGVTGVGVGRCTRDVDHDGAHCDYKRNLYWQAGDR